MNNPLRIQNGFVKVIFLSFLFFILPLSFARAEDVSGQVNAVEAQKEAIENKVESIRERIVETKGDKEAFDYVIGLVERAKNVAGNPRLQFRFFIAEILWTEKEMAGTKDALRELSAKISTAQNRLQFVDRDIAIRELLNSFAKENPAIRESVASRKQNREEYFAQLQDLENQRAIQNLKLDLITEYREVLERNRWRRLWSQFSQEENIKSAVFYLLKRAALTVIMLFCFIFIYRVVIWAGHWLASFNAHSKGGEQRLFIDTLKLIKFVFFFALIFAGVCSLFEIWDFGLSRLELLWQSFKGAHFFIGAIKIAIMSLCEAILTLWIFWTAAQFVNGILSQLVYPKLQMEESLQYSYSVIIRYAFFIVGLILALHILGIPLSSLSLFTGALGIGVGFGLQELFKNFIAGLNLLMERQVKVGDLIQLGDLPGKVREINAQNTVVDTFDNISVVVPNLEFTNQRIINWSHSDKTIRTNLAVGVAYGSDTQLVKRTLLDVAKSHPKILKHPEPSVIFENFGESSLDFKLFVWINEPENRLSILSDLHFEVDRKFREAKIEIPFPQRDLHLKSSVKLPLSN